MSQCTVHGYAAKKQGGVLEPHIWNLPALAAVEVTIAIHVCGMCHSDLHQIDNDWGGANFPLVPGHEIIGNITHVGDDVADFKVGDVVGVGPQIGSCDECEACLGGMRQLCVHKVKAYNSKTADPSMPFTFGGYSSHINVRSDWIFRIPEGLDIAETAPLLCAGITTWTPMLHLNGTSRKKVGILGMGGLGHVAVQFGVAMGHEVVVLSRSVDKQAQAKQYGATFLCTSDPDQIAAATGSFDFILSTVSAWLDYNIYLKLIKAGGRLALVGLPSKKLEIEAKLLVASARSLVGSYLANRKEIVNMLQFCALHGIKAKIQRMPISEANVGLQMLRDNTARYRVVLDISK